MALKNMALTEVEINKALPSPLAKGVESGEPQYPYGLCLSLDERSLKLLGVKNLPEVGQTMQILANVQIRSVGEYASLNDGVRRSMDLQITDMEFVSAKKEVDVSKLYSEVIPVAGKTYGKLNDSAEKDGG
jgi:hypothetical protein